jgi:hypothetical protein
LLARGFGKHRLLCLFGCHDALASDCDSSMSQEMMQHLAV